jgi:hypothetical protein
MKLIVKRFVAVVMVLAVAGACKGKSGDDLPKISQAPTSSFDVATTTTTTALKRIAAVGEQYEVEGGTVAVLAVARGIPGEYAPDPGEEWMAIQVKACTDATSTTHHLRGYQFQVQLSDDSRATQFGDAKKPTLKDGDIPPGSCLSGWVSYKIPQGSTPALALFTSDSTGLLLRWQL